MSRQILEEKFGWYKSDPEFSAFKYQMPSGGLTLLPYSSEDLELSARVASLHASGFDNMALTNYFFKKLEYVGYSPNGYHVFKGLPFDDHRNLKGVPRSKKFLFVHIEPKNDKFKLRYAPKQHAAIQ
jgi:hypothetical protein